MKKLLHVVLLLFPLCLSAQEVYHSFTEDHKEWHYFLMYSPETKYQMYTDGDTIVGGHVCMKLYSNGYMGNVSTPGFKEQNFYQGALYDEGRQTFFIESGSETPRLLYDFGIELGDTISSDNSEQFVVTEEDMQPFGDRNFRRLTVVSIDDTANSGYFVEGVGSSGTYFLNPFYLSTWHFVRFVACYVDGELLYYDRELFGDTLPDAYTSIHNPSATGFSDNSIYDLQGRKVDTSSADGRPQLPRGVYIQNGRKFVIK